jgi:hypothetical protein
VPGKPKFDPNQPFEVVERPAPVAGGKPKFDPSQPFEAVGEPPPPDPGALPAFGRGAAQGVTLGFGDELQAGVGAGLDALGLGAEMQGQSFYERYKAYRDAERQRDSQAASQHPIANTAGAVSGGLALPVGALGGAGGTARAIGSGAGLGGLAGLGHSTADSASGLASDAARGAALGGVLGAGASALGGAGRGIDRRNVARAADDWLEPTALGGQGLAARSAGPAVSAGSTQPSLPGAARALVGNLAAGAVGGAVGGLPGSVLGNAAYQLATSPTAQQATRQAVRGATAGIERAMTDPRFAQVLQSASQRGPQAVAATHWILQQQNPEYRAKTVSESEAGAR